MDKELSKMMEDLKETLNLMTKFMGSDIQKEIDKSFNEEATISIKKHKDGSADVNVGGKTLAVLITLAGLERGILKKLEVPDEIWEMIKDITGCKEGSNE